ncbi:putative membrane spanning protein [Bifidobacterium minimum]|uniref:Putative membrane spanning protein n=1 Tax=Bifidobacterium minimum TaxID=1693 RepID=A0A087BM68_9BIFI|nr:putative membrane spanning protein [Bifidobacterium minimum]
MPGVLIAMLPAWVIAFRSTFGTVSDFLSPCAGYLVERFGAFKALAVTEGLEGVLCLVVALVPSGWSQCKWLLPTLACLLLVTGQVIDVASEVFEVDAAEGDDDMLIRYSGIVGSISSLIGTPIALVASTAFLVITPSLVKRKPKP